MQDSNLRMHESKSCALPTWLIPIIKLVSAQGFEPRTHALEGRCSIQLSYGTSLIFGCKGSAFYENSKTFWNFFIHIFLWCYESVFYERSFFI